jgi:indolepyruvate ferredoxin oxidoreductase
VRNNVAGENLRLEFHLAPPLFARRDANTGEPRKISVGAWMMPVFRTLAKFRFLRGTPFDPFGYLAERRTERALIADYEAMLAEVLDRLGPANHATAVALAGIPEKIRGYGHVKARHLKAAKAEEATLLEHFRAGGAPLLKAAE